MVVTLYTCQMIWSKKMLEELNFKRQGSMIIFCDNNSTIKLFKIKFYIHGRNKHINVKFHFLRDLTKNGTIEIIYCKREYQVSDIFIKSFKLESFVKLRRLLGVCTQEDLV